MLIVAAYRRIEPFGQNAGGVDRVTQILETTDITILSGDDGLTLPMMALGAVGVISVASNVVPATVAALVERAARDDVAAARAVHDALAPLVRALFLESNPIPVKAALHLTGRLPEPTVRLPLVEASEETRLAVARALEGLEASVRP